MSFHAARGHYTVLMTRGSQQRPIEVGSAAAIEPRILNGNCHCGGEYRILEHEWAGSGRRRVDVKCRYCSAPRSFWFRLVVTEPN